MEMALGGEYQNCPGYIWKSPVINWNKKIATWKSQSTDMYTQIIQMLASFDVHFKTAIIKLIQWAIENIAEIKYIR